MSAQPFFLAPTARKPDTKADDFTASLGGPIARDKWHYYGAYEYVDRSLITGGQVITVNPADAQALGITLPADGVIPAHQQVNFWFGKTDYQLSKGSNLSVRYFGFKNNSPSNIGGGLTTTDRATDFTDRMDSTSGQVVSSIGGSMLNELRVQYARRHQFRTPGISVDGPAITVSGKAEFGGARIGDGNSVGFDFNQGITQVIDNLSVIRGRHAFKGGIDAQWIADRRVRGELFQYTFATIAAYQSAKSGADPFSYTNFQQQLGDLSAKYNSGFYGLFVQDDWQLSARLKLLYGLRYDLFNVPEARPFAANPYSQDFAIDKNNFGPRAGISWSLDDQSRTVVRASVGLMYEPPLLDFYDNAILSNGDPKSYNIGPLQASAVGAPPFPADLASPPPGFVLPRQSINAVDPDFRTQSAWLSNVQVERALNNEIAVTVGYVNSMGRKLPVLIDINLVPSAQSLADGRPIFSTSARVDPTFNRINMLVNYNKQEFNQAQYGPFPVKVGQDRVTDENAPIEVLVPNDPVFTVPNQIREDAWKGWVQERGTYFLAERDPRYVDLVRLADPFPLNPGAKTGALVEAKYGKGRWIYIGLGLWRQLPAGTDGAYELLANLLSLGKK